MSDYQYYIDTVASTLESAEVDIWAYCLMPNHVHVVAVPKRSDSLATLFRTAHRQYTRRVNFREGWRGHLWQERFHSFVMDEEHLAATVRYVELNPVRSSLCKTPQDWRWSSARAHLAGVDDDMVTSRPMLSRFPNWAAYLDSAHSDDSSEVIRQHTRTGRPAGDAHFVEKLESLTGRKLRKSKPGPKGNK